jgi:hypothetical protein
LWSIAIVLAVAAAIMAVRTIIHHKK